MTYQASYKKRYELARHRGIETSPVPSQPVLAHIETLTDLGWSAEAISCMTRGAITHAGITRLTRERYGTSQRRTAAAILALPVTLALPESVPDTCMVPALGAVRRVRALMRLGWNHEAMRERYGFDTTALARNRVKQMAAWKWRAVAAMYDELSMTLGPSVKTATYARNYKWPAPLAWWDVDDPHEEPYTNKEQVAGAVVDREVVARLLRGEALPSTRAEKAEAMRRWLAAGKSERSLSMMHGWKEGRYTPRQEPAA